MLLTIDVGNTNSVFAVFDKESLVGKWRISTAPHRTADEYGIWLLQIFAQNNIKPENIKAAISSTVVPDAEFALLSMCREYFSTELIMVGQDLKLNMKVKIDKPSEVGADRLVNSIEAWQRYKQAVVIVDFGTATTFDVVNAEGDYIGGVIATGVNLSLDALHKAAAKLPNVRIDRPDKVIGKSTISAMQSGMYYGYLSMVDGIIARITEEMAPEINKKIKVIATGGLAPLYAKGSKLISETVEDLTIYGLKTIYEGQK